VTATEIGELVGLLAAMAWGATGLLVRALNRGSYRADERQSVARGPAQSLFERSSDKPNFGGAGLNAMFINAARCGISGLVFIAIWPFLANRQPVPTAAWLFLGTSMLLGLGLGDSLYFEALKRIGVSRAMPISMGYPVLAAIGAVVLLHESLGPLAAVGIALTLGGVYLVAARPRAEAEKKLRVAVSDWSGVALAVAAAVSWSCSTLALGPALSLVDVPTVSAIRTPLASAVLFAAAARTGVLPPAGVVLRSRVALLLLATGAASVVSTGAFVVSVALAGAGRAAVLTATSPLFAVPLSVV
jgi:drug/metabolite transporter, DME family